MSGLVYKFEGRSAVHLAAALNFVDFINIFVKHELNIDLPNFFGERPIIQAIRMGHLQAAKALINAGAGVKSETPGVTNPSQFYPSPLYIAIELDSQQNNFPIVYQLIFGGAISDLLKEYHFHPFFIAICKGSEFYIKLLLKRGIDVNLRDAYHKKALHLASEKGNSRIVTLLYEMSCFKQRYYVITV